MAIIHNHLGSNIAAVIFLGAGNCGKGTQVKKVLDLYEGYDITVGEEVRKKLKSDENFLRQYGEIVTDGKLLPDPVIFDLTAFRAKEIIRPSGIILVDGFCRNKHQADMIDNLFACPEHIIAFEFTVDLDTVLQRAKDRGRKDDIKAQERFALWRNNRKDVVKKLGAKGIKTIPLNGRLSEDEVFQGVRSNICDHVKALKGSKARKTFHVLSPSSRR